MSESINIELLKEGDLVRLKSGGNFMTVVCINKKSIGVHWFENDKREMEAYPPECLVKIY